MRSHHAAPLVSVCKSCLALAVCRAVCALCVEKHLPPAAPQPVPTDWRERAFLETRYPRPGSDFELWVPCKVRACNKMSRVTVFTFSFTDNLGDKHVSVNFVQDTSKFWYKADISREQGAWAGRDPRVGTSEGHGLGMKGQG